MSERERGFNDGYYTGESHPPMTTARERDEYDDGFTIGVEQHRHDSRGSLGDRNFTSNSQRGSQS